MTVAKRLAASVVAVALIGGCASSGGGGSGKATATYSDGSTRELTLQEFFACLITVGLVCPRSPNSSTTTSSSSASDESTYYESSTARTQESAIATPSPLTFSRWQDIGPDTQASVRGPQAEASFTAAGTDGAVIATAAPSASATGSAIVSYGTSGTLQHFNPGRSFVPGVVAKGFNAESGMDVAWGESSSGGIGFTDEPKDVALVANPYQLGWDYQSFGAWSDTSFPSMSAKALSFGAPSPASAVPTAGSAEFLGKLAGMYVSPVGSGFAVGADVRVSADFSRRSLTLSSARTIATRGPQGVTSETVPQLNLSGTLTYAAASNTFSGTLANAGGTMTGTSKGQFYGPAAQELGGVFALKSGTSRETFVGAYGAKR